MTITSVRTLLGIHALVWVGDTSPQSLEHAYLPDQRNAYLTASQRLPRQHPAAQH